MLFQPDAQLRDRHTHMLLSHESQETMINHLAISVAHVVSNSMGIDLYGDDHTPDPFHQKIFGYQPLIEAFPIEDKPLAAQDFETEKRTTTEDFNLNWLLPENDPKSPNDYKLSLKQEEKLIELHGIEKSQKCDFSAISIGSKDNRFYQALERRGLIEMVDSEVVGRKHKMYWKLTSAGRGTAINLSDLPF